jgi:hypothetical protein
VRAFSPLAGGSRGRFVVRIFRIGRRECRSPSPLQGHDLPPWPHSLWEAH